MWHVINRYKYAVTALCVGFSLAAMAAFPSRAETDGLAPYFKELADPNDPGWSRAEADIRRAWSRSGSPAMDLLLKRGESALDDGDTEAAIEHFTALVDHAPDFAEGWNGRATAYFMAGLYGPAASDIAHVLKLEPRHWGALAGLGTMLEEMGDDSRALKAYQASFALNPHQQDVKDAIARLDKTHQGTAL
ncbi:hypothetical protein DL1_05740 [Thioclava dalianensis]|uniref:Uncharacterized protein n=2 Tax=Thioclava dalianensis TaxID=1185766 RepID=A0A074U347_9RHOB|nr:hypothetical protein DL1_05740 [Thioclava dalianensis]SFM84304.1 Tetratricopeptide repeat-containing protein [Thioclava dalianensis]